MCVLSVLFYSTPISNWLITCAIVQAHRSIIATAGIDVMSKLESELQSELLNLHRKWGTIGYHANYFKRMLVCRNPKYVRGAIGTVRHLLSFDLPSPGFQRLVRAGKREWTVEALLCDPKWHSLLTPTEIERAKTRARQI